MAGDIFAQPFYTAFDSNGDPLSGEKLYFYATGITTPTTVSECYALGFPH